MRLKATHFVEVYQGGDKVLKSPLYPIEKLAQYLYTTKMIFGVKTVQVWKIKFKENAD